MRANLESLVRDYRSGDNSAFEKIYNSTYRQIFFVVIPIVKDRSLAEDIVQDTYLKFIEKVDDYKSKNLLSYLITIGKNLAINEYNKRKKVLKIEDFTNFSYYDLVEIKAEYKEMITKALSVLNNIEKNIFLLHILEDLTHREIGEILDKPIGTISWIYAKAIRKMKKRLKDDYYEY